MSRPFVPFKSFEQTAPMGKTLHESMESNCDDRLAPDEPEPCSDKPCPPYWQDTGEIRCLSNGLIDKEEADGCGNTRWTRTVDLVIWVNGEETQCNDPQDATEIIYLVQTNQCGETRQIDTGKKCCTPEWIDAGTEGPIYDCETNMLRKQQINGCGGTRLVPTANPVLWTNTGQTRCSAGDNYEAEQVNQCGTARWVNVGACPCVPNWVTNGIIRCVSANVENQEIDGCGGTRWVDSGTTLLWTNTGNSRCDNLTGKIQYEQINQCGALRWFTSADVCEVVEPPVDPTPPPNTINMEGIDGSGCYTVAHPGYVEYFLAFGGDGQLTEGSSMSLATVGNAGYWVNPADVSLYEVRVGTASDNLAAGQWYQMPQTIIWSESGGNGVPGGRFIYATITIRRKSDGLPMASKTLGGVQLGVGTECV